ncbi:hypothetical protein FJ948_09420 [Mesorhizobium sp. B2-3-12]|nr:hypothetical protein FJ948_09420 [Mesorhizobium sp. B2-3-12]
MRDGSLPCRTKRCKRPILSTASLRWNTPHPSRRCAPIHLLPQGEKGSSVAPAPHLHRQRRPHCPAGHLSP